MPVFIPILLLLLSSVSAVHAQLPVPGDYDIRVHGLRLACSIRGNGPMMLAGHPTAGKTGYQLSLSPLEAFFTMVYYDPRGTGHSEVPKQPGGYQLDSLVAEIEQLRISLQAKHIWLFGHSDQSAVALTYALKYPQHTAGLILSGTSLIGTQEESQRRRKAAEATRSLSSPWFAGVLRDWDHMEQQHTDVTDNGRTREALSVRWWCYDERTAQKVMPIVRAITAAGRRKAIQGVPTLETPADREQYLRYQEQFSTINVPILILNGTHDTNNQIRYAERLQQTLAHATLKLIGHAGHFPWVENPDASFEAINQWLKSLQIIISR